MFEMVDKRYGVRLFTCTNIRMKKVNYLDGVISTIIATLRMLL